AGTIEIFEVGAQSNTEPANREIAQTSREIESEEVYDDAISQTATLYPAGNVNRLMVVNRSDKPLYLMPGEVIVGGSQDRTVAQSAIIAANSEPIAIDVYCVEHGRWGGRSLEETSALFCQDPLDADEVEALAESA